MRGRRGACDGAEGAEGAGMGWRWGVKMVGFWALCVCLGGVGCWRWEGDLRRRLWVGFFFSGGVL